MLAPLIQRVGLLTPTVASVLARPGAVLAWVVDITWKNGAGRYAVRDFASSSLGLYKGVLIDAGEYDYAASDRNFGISSQSPSIIADDTSYEIADRIQEGDAYGVPVLVRLAVQDAPVSEWPIVFKGVLRGWEETEPLRWRLTFGYDDAPLRAQVPRTVIPREDFLYASDEARSGIGPLIFGRHLSAGVGGHGMIPAKAIDTTHPDFLVGRAAPIVLAEFVDEIDATPLTGSVDYPRPSGRLYAIVEGDELDPPVDPPGTQVVVTLDVLGYGSTPQTGTATLTNGADELRILCDNWIWEEFGGQEVWLVGTSPLHLGWLDSCRKHLDARNARSARYIDARSEGGKLIEDWSHDHQYPAFWTMDGHLALRPFDDAIVNVYGHVWIKWHEKELGPLSVRFDSIDLVRQIDARYLHIAAADSLAFSLSVVDPHVPFPTAEPFDDYWSESAVS